MRSKDLVRQKVQDKHLFVIMTSITSKSDKVKPFHVNRCATVLLLLSKSISHKGEPTVCAVSFHAIAKELNFIPS
jgi:hypothetical protein